MNRNPNAPTSVQVGCNYTLGSGTIGTHTATVHAYVLGGAGAYGADLFSGVPSQAIPAFNGVLTFVASANAGAGARIILSVVMVVQDTGGHNITATIGGVRFGQ